MIFGPGDFFAVYADHIRVITDMEEPQPSLRQMWRAIPSRQAGIAPPA